MSAHILQHVRKRLQTAPHAARTEDGYRIVEYTESFSWEELLVIARDAIDRGWLLERVPGQELVTKLRLIRPVQISNADRETGSCTQPPQGRNSGSGSEASRPEEGPNSRRGVRDTQNTVQTVSRTPELLNADTAVAASVQSELSLEDTVQEYEVDAEIERIIAARASRRSPTVATKASIGRALLHWDAETLIQFVQGNAEIPLSTLFSSVRGVAKRMGCAVPERVTWLTPFRDSFSRRWPMGQFRHGLWANTLSPLVKKFSSDLVLREFEGYLDRTEPMYISPTRFAEGFGSWAGQKRALVASSKDVGVTVL